MKPSWLRRFPRLFLALRGLKYLGRAEPIDPQVHEILNALGGEPLRVAAGPFAGMRYLPAASGSGLLPKLAGTYERELAEAVRRSFGRGYDRVINVGCGEGYYAVGYALALPAARIHAFDTDPLARQRARRLAKLNGVAHRVEVAGLCRPADLAPLLAGRCLVVCDCEGCELDLLDPALLAGLATADLLVELHDFLAPTLSATLLPRFATTHRVEILDARPRTEADLPPALAAVLTPEQRGLTLYEGRPMGMQWASLVALRGEVSPP